MSILDVQPLNVGHSRPKPESKYHFWLSAGLNLCITILIIVDVSLQQWYHYCYFDFGLTTAHTWMQGLNQRLSGHTYSDIDSGLCEGYKVVIEAACNDFCVGIESAWRAGIVMIIFAVLCLVCTIVYAVLHVLLARGRRYMSWLLYVSATQYGIWACPILFLMGVICYVSIAEVYRLNRPWNGNEEVTTGSGLNLAYSIIVFSLVPALHSYLFTSAYLIGRN